MDQIKNVMIGRLKHKGGRNFKSLNVKDLGFLFELYDKIIFDNQLFEQISKLWSRINFKLNKKTELPAVSIIAGEELIVDISPNVLICQKIFKTRLDALQVLMEYCIVHLMIILWDYEKVNKQHKGKLFDCVYESYFKREKVLESKGFTKIKDSRIQRRSVEINSYVNWADSCYLDSVLTILLQVPKIRDIIFSSTPPTLNGKTLKQYLIQDYESREEKCTSIRQLLSDIIPELKEEDEWVPYNAPSIYSHIVDLIPSLTMTVPYIIYKNGVKGNLKKEKRASLEMWDYLESGDLTEGFRKQIIFNKMKSPILVFTNGGVPRIKRFNEEGTEEGTEKDVKKVRKFGKGIISDKYQLVGVVTLHGVTDDGEGAHYTCYFKNENGWYYYNDVGPTIKKVKKLPENGVWVEDGGKMPSMYFYIRK